jgi:hypothetical protein
LDNVTPIRPGVTPSEPECSGEPIVATKPRVSYVDDDRDYQDVLVLNAMKAAIQLIDAEEPGLAGDVLRLARDRLAACWPTTDVKFTVSVDNTAPAVQP